jgi:VWFA-related protein
MASQSLRRASDVLSFGKFAGATRMIPRSIFPGLVLSGLLLGLTAHAQKPSSRDKQSVRTVTIPISIYTKKELRQDQTEEFVQVDRLIVKEDKEEQTILSVRSVMNTPISLAVLIQDDLASTVNLQLRDISRFIRNLPKGSRVMVGYIHGGTLRVRQRFTDNLDKAASLLQVVGGTPSANGPYDGVSSALNYFEALPGGRRAILLVSDGLEAPRGGGPLDSINSPELDRSILKAQRKGVALYSIYFPSALTENSNSTAVLAAQGALYRLSDETGGRAFYQGSIAPVSFEPFLKDLDLLLGRQFALTYLSTHMKKGYHRIDVTSTNPEVKIEHPKGYYYR